MTRCTWRSVPSGKAFCHCLRGSERERGEGRSEKKRDWGRQTEGQRETQSQIRGRQAGMQRQRQKEMERWRETPRDTDGFPKQHTRGDPPKTPEFIYRNSCVYSHMFKLQSPSKHSPLDAIHLLRHFFHCSKQFLNLSSWCLFMLLPFFVSSLPSPISSQNVSLYGLFSSGETKKVTWGEIGWIRRVEHGGHVGVVKNC